MPVAHHRKLYTDKIPVIKSICNTTDQLKYNIQSILFSFLDFYTHLYASEYPSKSDIRMFLEQLLGTVRRRSYKQLSSCPLGKTPCLDGYSVKFYKDFWPQTEPPFKPMLTDFFQKWNPS